MPPSPPSFPAVVALSEEVQRISDPIGDATARGIRADIKFRGVMVGVMCLLFLGLNGAVMLVLYLAFQADMTLLQRTPPLPAADRLVTANVLMALIGATVVQTGIGFVSIVSYLFPKREVDQR
ncbi:MAG TPA: hypothetical protein VK439_07975 [Rubrivivax sp.]|nr:hypothetical protein [Rubrivivax sp.]